MTSHSMRSSTAAPFSTKCHLRWLLSVRKPKTSDFLRVKFRCFASKVRRFASKKSDVFGFPKPLLQKKFCVFLLHFLHQSLKSPLFIGDFG